MDFLWRAFTSFFDDQFSVYLLEKSQENCNILLLDMCFGLLTLVCSEALVNTSDSVETCVTTLSQGL